jgi:hypothetical protein
MAMSPVTLLATMSWTSILVAIAAMLSLRGMWLVVYRLFFHPLSNVPGPRLAAITYWYEGYFDAYLLGQFGFKIEELHQKYGKLKVITIFDSTRLTKHRARGPYQSK